MKTRSALALALAAILLAGCRSIGPRTMSVDRVDYSEALSRSWKNQMLLNIVRVRYADLPVFVEVGQIVSGYSLETSVNLTGSIGTSGDATERLGSLGGGGRFIDRPTITYIPKTGESFLEGMLQPIKPSSVFKLIQSGYPADFLLELCCNSFNGLKNQPASILSLAPADPEFMEAARLLRDIQLAGALTMSVEKGSIGSPDMVIFFRHENLSESTISNIERLREILGVDQDQYRFYLVYSSIASSKGTLGVETRSLYQVLVALSSGVVIPESHRKRGIEGGTGLMYPEQRTRLVVQSGLEEPGNAFVKVEYEGEWFWIAEDDFISKRTFSSILFLFTLADQGGLEQMPTLTIPTQ